jgi:hypothetical protein
MMRPRSLARVSGPGAGLTENPTANLIILGVVAVVVVGTFYLYYWVGKTVLKGQKF